MENEFATAELGVEVSDVVCAVQRCTSALTAWRKGLTLSCFSFRSRERTEMIVILVVELYLFISEKDCCASVALASPLCW